MEADADDGDGRVRDVAQRGGGGRRVWGQQRGGRGGGRGDDDAFGFHRRAPGDGDAPPAAGGGNRFDALGAPGNPARAQRRGQRNGELSEAVGERDRAAEAASAGSARAPQPAQDAAVLALERGQPWQRGAHRQLGRVARVDANQRGRRRALGGLAAEATRDEVDDRLVRVGGRAP